jgi:hypothetical protein
LPVNRFGTDQNRSKYLNNERILSSQGLSSEPFATGANLSDHLSASTREFENLSVISALRISLRSSWISENIRRNVVPNPLAKLPRSEIGSKGFLLFKNLSKRHFADYGQVTRLLGLN